MEIPNPNTLEMKSTWRPVLLFFAIWSGALFVLFLKPRQGEGGAEWRDNAPEQAPAGQDSSLIESGAGEAEGEETAEALFAEPAVSLPEEVTPDEAIARLLSKPVDLADPLVRQDLVGKIKRLEDAQEEETRKKAQKLGLPLRTEDGAVLVGFEGDQPLYDIDHNANAAISTGANLVNLAPYNADGAGYTIGLWEAGEVPRLTHQEFGGRVTIGDGTNPSQTDMHASHVAGTLMAAGQFDPLVKGMAPSALLKAHTSSDELSEMTALAAAAVGVPDTIYLSNHSYGTLVGWNDAKTAWYGTFSDDGNPGNDYVSRFGQYSTTTSGWDGLAWNAPYYLIFKSAGNDRNDAAPTEGATWLLNNSSSNQFTYDSITHPTADYSWQIDAGTTGFGTIGHRGTGKNIVTVGSVTDAVSGGNRSVGVATLNSFSSAGPTDDGRIKPDLMANGNSLRSLDDDSDSDTQTASGTSMASPNAGGSALLLIDYYDSLFPGEAMLASTLKGLLIHTADEMGNPGPDYRFGWGLMNVKAAADLLDEHATYPNENRLVEGELDGANPDDEVTVTYDGSGEFRVTICWTDPAGSFTSAHDSHAKRLVHDLNLTVTGPGGTHLPYVMPWVDDWSDSKLDDDATTGLNTVDNVEQVYIEGPQPGDYTIRVDHAGALVQGSQKYSLVVSGAAIMTGPPVVHVDNPVADMAFLGDSTNPIPAVADVNTVFSGTGHTYDVSVSPAGILAAVIQPDGTVDFTPTTVQFGTATVTLTATDASQNVAEDAFDVTIASPILHVDANTVAAEGSEDGFSWATAYAYLKDALGVAQSGQEIWVAEGIYYPDEAIGQNTNDQAELFVVPVGVSMYGGFANGATSRAEADPQLHNTHLSGDITQNDGPPAGSYTNGLSTTTTSTNSYNVLDLSACDASAMVTGFIISGGYASGGAVTRGGGVYSNGGSATVKRCMIAGNYANQRGAGIYLEGGTPRVIDCLVSGNWVGADGGGLWTESSTVTLHNCAFRGNTSSGAGGLGVNGIGGESVTAVNCSFSGGKGFFGSGGVQVQAGNLSLINCTITGNYCSAIFGGGILVNGSSAPVVVDNCIVWNNRAGGTTTTAGSSIGFASTFPPVISNSLIHNSGGSGNWNGAVGTDGLQNIDGDPAFVDPVTPNLSGDEGGDFSLAATSAALNGGDSGGLPPDLGDVDNDGDLSEPIPLDLAGVERIVSTTVDQGAFEFTNLDLIDADHDGIADSFELAATGDFTALEPLSDLDGNGLSALAEFAHGHEPGTPLESPVAPITLTDLGGQDYLTVTYLVRDTAMSLVQVEVERCADLTTSWQSGQTVQISSTPVAGGLTQIVARSGLPIGTTPSEFLRLRQEVAAP